MYLARDKNGNLGRQLPKPGETAQVVRASQGSRRGNVVVSTRQIDEDEKYYAALEAKRNAELRTQAIRNKANAIAKANAHAIKQAEVMQQQKPAKLNRTEQILKRYFMGQANMTESEKTIRALSPDFNNDGNQNVLPADPWQETRNINWRSDFRNALVLGNPITRDGAYGPSTDWERFVNAKPFRDSDRIQVIGGTIVGRVNGHNIPCETTQGKIVSKSENLGRFGADEEESGSWWDSATDWFSDLGTNTAEQLQEQIPEAGTKWLINELIPGQKPPTGGGTTNVVRPPGSSYLPGGTTTVFGQQMPVAALYIGGGILGLGVLLVLMKAMKS